MATRVDLMNNRAAYAVATLKDEVNKRKGSMKLWKTRLYGDQQRQETKKVQQTTKSVYGTSRPIHLMVGSFSYLKAGLRLENEHGIPVNELNAEFSRNPLSPHCGLPCPDSIQGPALS